LPALPNLQNILATRDMVFVDQRGTLHPVFAQNFQGSINGSTTL
jgi:hypothetical protein